jgi:4-hydroxy-tetrahydrodipicolinate synthase
MKYRKSEAKDWARAHMRGIWAAALTPFTANGAIDEAAWRANMHHWTHELGIDGLFISGKQGEFFAMSLEERKRSFEIAVEATAGTAGTIMSCSDQNMDVVIELAHHAQQVGADAIVVHAPVLHFLHKQDETLLRYYETISAEVDIAIALWSHPDSGYLMSPELCARIADVPNIVAIKYSVPREMYMRLHDMAHNKLIVSTASEEEWLDNIIDMNWQLYLCSTPPYLLQTAHDKRMRDYTDLAFAGQFDEARRVRDSLAPVRKALSSTRPPEKPHAHQKFWQNLLGQRGGYVRAPMLELTEVEKEATRQAFAHCGLKV